MKISFSYVLIFMSRHILKSFSTRKKVEVYFDHTHCSHSFNKIEYVMSGVQEILLGGKL